MIDDETPTVRLGGGLPKDSEAGKGGAGAVRNHKVVRFEPEAGAGEGKSFRESTFFVQSEHLVSRSTPPEWRGIDYAKQQADVTIEDRFARAFIEVDKREIQQFVMEMQRRIASVYVDPRGWFRGSDGGPVTKPPEPEKSPLEKALEIDPRSRIDKKFK